MIAGNPELPIDSALSNSSTNAVQNRVITNALSTKSTVEVTNSGTASSTSVHDFTISVDGGAENVIRRYMEQTLTTSITDPTPYTFISPYIATGSVIDVYADKYGVIPSNVEISEYGGSCTVTIPKQATADSLTIRIYIM